MLSGTHLHRIIIAHYSGIGVCGFQHFGARTTTLNGDMDSLHLTPGFDDAELVSQQTFRAIVKALDNPGHLVQIKSKLLVPGVLNSASAALFLTLCNDGTTVWADINWNFALIDWFQYQCGCSIVTEPCMASLALITEPLSMPPLDHFRIADDDHPDTSATLIIQVSRLFANAVVSPTRPKSSKTATQSAMGVPANQWYSQYLQSGLFSQSIDIFLTCNNILTALPHLAV